MRIRASVSAIVRVAALLAACLAGAACTSGAGGRLMVDAPKLVPYQPPDIDEITGIDSEEAEEAEPASGSAQNPQK